MQGRVLDPKNQVEAWRLKDSRFLSCHVKDSWQICMLSTFYLYENDPSVLCGICVSTKDTDVRDVVI